MKVVNLRKEKFTIYIGRGSIFGNPFIIDKNGTRQEVIEKYKEWIETCLFMPNRFTLTPLGRAIFNLPKDAILGCYCKPKACHGDIIIKIWKEMHDRL